MKSTNRKERPVRLKAPLIGMIAVAACHFTFAADIYVAADGNDANDGLTPATAKATIAGGYDALTNGLPAATYGNRLVVGAGTFDLPTVTTVLSNGWKIAGAGKDKTTLKVTATVRQFALESADTELRGFKIDFIGSTMNMKGISGSLANEPRGTLADLDVVNYYAGSAGTGGTPINITDATCTPVFTNCVFRNFTLIYRNCVFYIKRGTVLITNCSFIDGKCVRTVWKQNPVHFFEVLRLVVSAVHRLHQRIPVRNSRTEVIAIRFPCSIIPDAAVKIGSYNPRAVEKRLRRQRYCLRHVYVIGQWRQLIRNIAAPFFPGPFLILHAFFHEQVKNKAQGFPVRFQALIRLIIA